MPIDTSSYYPEVPDPEGKDEGYSLNSSDRDLFDFTPPPSLPEPSDPPEPETPDGDESDAIDLSPSDHPLLDGIAHFLSWALVPLLVPVYGLLLAFGLSVLNVVPAGTQVRLTFIVFGITFGIPVIFVLILKYVGIVQDVGLNGRTERLIPYIITAICYGGTAWLMAAKGAPLWLVMFFAGGALASLVNLAVNFKWKISAHAAAVAGLIALLIRLGRDATARPELLVWLLITVGLTGLLGSSRVWLGRHTVWQVLAGYAVGFCSVFFLMGIR